jgi:glycosyltransferase involved in cell wall biosynthesis
MKIAIMGAWNSSSGAAYHAEMIGRSFVEMGHDVKVFTFYDYSFHGFDIVAKHEDYVECCFTTSRADEVKFDPVPFLTNDYDLFIVEDLGMLPKDELGKIFHHIKSRAKTMTVIHDGKLTDDPSFYQFDWDALIAFDERYRDFLVKGYDPDKVHMIPYPACPENTGDKAAARKKLDLPEDRKIVFTFGGAAWLGAKLIPAISTLKDEYPVTVLGVSKDKRSLEWLRSFQESGIMDIEIREDAPDLDGLYEYLYAVDTLVVNKPDIGHIVLSSTIYQCLGSGCPIVALHSCFTEMFGGAAILYSNMEEFIAALRSVFDEDKTCKNLWPAAQKFIADNSAGSVAEQFISLYEKIS